MLNIQKKTNFIFFIDSLNLGGAERLLVNLCNELASRGLSTVLICFYDGVLSEKLDTRVRLIKINGLGGGGFFLRIVKRIRKEIYIWLPNLMLKNELNSNTIAISFLENRTTELVSKLKGVEKRISWVHTDIERVEKTPKEIYLLHNKFDKIIFPTEICKKNFIKFIDFCPTFEEKLIVINNGIPFKEICEKSNDEAFNINLINYSLSVGRVCEPKGYFDLIEKFYRLKEEGVDFKHIIIGDGPDFHMLEKAIMEKGLHNNIYLYGALENPYPFIKNARLVVINSYWEGYCLVLAESICLGVAVIARKIPVLVEVATGITGPINFYNNYEDFKTLYLNNRIRNKYKIDYSNFEINKMADKVLRNLIH